MTDWKPNGSNAQYWRDDNPLIMAWHRFGDDLPPNFFKGDTPEDHLSGLMTDSSMMKAHLMSKTDPSTIISAVSGLAPWSVSGMKFDGASWTDANHPNAIGYHAHIGSHDGYTPVTRDGGGTHGMGYMGFGSKTMHSGMMVAGWSQIAYPTDTPIAFRPLWGDLIGDTDSRWLVHYVAEDDGGAPHVLRLVLRNETALTFGGAEGNSPFWNGISTIATVDNAASAFPIPIDEPFFWAFTVHRELTADAQSPAPHQQSSPYGAGGSGLLTMYLGTTSSGLFKVAEQRIEGTLGNSANSTPVLQFAIGQREGALRGGGSHFGITQNSIFDEFIFVHDGYMGFDRIEHYMNSGILTFPANNPQRPEFVPQLPGTDDLNAYFTWDNSDSLENWLANSAPVTSGIFASVMGGAGKDRPGPGIRGGSGIILDSLEGPGLGDSWTPARNSDRWHVPVGSGRNWMFPDINRTKAMTWIGWLRPARLNSTLASTPFGWFTDGTDHLAYCPSNWFDGGLVNDGDHVAGNGVYINEAGGTNWNVSGSILSLADTQSAMGGLGNVGVHAEEWSLWAFVIDFENGVSYTVKNAKIVNLNPLQISPASGWSDEVLLGNTAFGAADRTTEGAAWLFATVGAWGAPGSPAVDALADDWAFYDRVLTIPEMSGYALSGIAVTPPISPLDTSFKQTRAFWKLDGSGIYDPTGVSGVRFDDSSWYSHHLTNVSGIFSIRDELNLFIDTDAVQLDTSGSMISLERVFTGSNLDFSTDEDMSPSGFSVGMWAYVPSGDLGTQGQGTSGLFGPRMLMGCWSQDANELSWFLGADNNILEGRIVLTNLIENQVTSEVEIPFNTPFFLGMDVQPSGSVLASRLWYSTDPLGITITQIAETTFGASSSLLNSSSASGFSLFNAPNLNYGFPQTTAGQGVFIYDGAMPENTWGRVKNLGINNNVLGANSVSTTDPENISHWKFDRPGSRFIDFGLEQNFVFPINQDGNNGGVIGSIHNSGVVIRRTEYYDTLASNPESRRLDLGSGSQSWTFLSWVLPPVISTTDEHTIMSKSASESGVRIYTPSTSLQLLGNASGAVARAQNGNLAPTEWNHIAMVYDRDNNEFTTIVNGRYAGAGFESLPEVPVNNSGMVLGGRGDQESDAIAGGSAFSGYLDDTMVFSRALTLPEISGLAASSYTYDPGSDSLGPVGFGGWISGISQLLVSGLIGSFMHGQAQDIELIAGYVSGVSGLCIPYGGFMHGKAQISGLVGGFMHGSSLASGVFGHFVHGLDTVSGFFGGYEFGACDSNGEFDIVLNFSVITNKDFDARLGVEKTQFIEFDSRLGVIRITRPPLCTFEAPLVGELGSGTPYVLTVQGSGIAQDDKKVAMTRFTFADFKGAESGTLVSGESNSGLFEAQREFDTAGWYTLKLEILDSYGYRTSCCRPFLLLPSGETSGVFINSLPGISIEATPVSGSAIHTVSFTHSLSGLNTTSGLLEYTDFADQQESLVNSTEMPVGTQFVELVRRHDYTMPGFYCPVWSVSGEFGIVSDSVADGIDYIV